MRQFLLSRADLRHGYEIVSFDPSTETAVLIRHDGKVIAEPVFVQYMIKRSFAHTTWIPPWARPEIDYAEFVPVQEKLVEAAHARLRRLRRVRESGQVESSAGHRAEKVLQS